MLIFLISSYSDFRLWQAYFVKLVSADYDDIKTWEYLDRVGIIHTGVQQQLNTGKASTKSPLRVEFIHMGLLLGATTR